VLEEFRIPPSFDPASVRVFNTNVFHFDAKALLDLDMAWTFFTVTKKVEGREVVQFERLVNEVTSALPTKYLHLPRTGEKSRFLPVKDNEELAARRSEIELVAKANGWL
jgi:UTP--glucose-1-phosphate uridylyltransferase